MSKKVAISIVVAVMVAVYVFILVVWPQLVDMLVASGYCSTEQATPLAMYFLPGVVGALIITAIVKSKMEAKEDG